LLTNDSELYRKASLLRQHGIYRREEMFDNEKRVGSWIYDMDMLGFNYRITDFQAALGLSQLKKLNSIKKRRRKIVNYYNENFTDIEELILPYEDTQVDSNFHIYVLQIKDNPIFDRYDLFKYLQAKDFLPMVHYIPMHLLSYYKNRYDYKYGDFPVAEAFYNRAISIPLYPSLTDSQVEKTVSTIRNYINK